MEEEERGWQVGGGLVEEEGEGHERGMGGNRQRKRGTQSSNSVGKTEFLWRVRFDQKLWSEKPEAIISGLGEWA